MVRVGGSAALVWLAATGIGVASEATLMINNIAPIELRLDRLASDPVTDPSKRFGAWIGGNGTRFHSGESGLRADLRQVSVGGGIDYRFLDTLTVGIGVTHEDTHVDLLDAFGRFDRVGWVVSPYLAWKAIPYVTLSVAAGWGELDNNLVTGAGGAGSYETDRWHVAAGISFNYSIGAWRLGAAARYLWLREVDPTFALDSGARINKDKRSIEQGRALISLGYDFGGFKPILIGGIEHEFEGRDPIFVGTRRVGSDRDGFLVGGGIDFALSPIQGTIRYVEERGRGGKTNGPATGASRSIGAGNAKRLEVSLELPF